MVRRLTDRVADFITETFQADKSEDAIWLTKPLFLSCIDGSVRNSSSTAGYSFLHVDRERQRHFRYSALLYLDDGGAAGSGRDFEGGELLFAGRRRPPRSRPFTVSPRAGKLVRFASTSLKVQCTPLYFLPAARYEHAGLGMIFGFFLSSGKICQIKHYRGQRSSGMDL